jgi:hypothetical protein
MRATGGDLGTQLALTFARTSAVAGKKEALMTSPLTPATLEVVVQSQRASTTREIMVRIRLRNTGDRDLWLNRRMLLNSGYVPEEYRELWLDILGPGSQRVEFACKVRTGPPQPEDYGLLEVGQAIEEKVKLAECFEISSRGTYRVVAHYRDGGTVPPPPPAGAAPLRGEVVSEPVVIKVPQE